jgi:ribonuclease BN (tRNA processing enzyme)
MIAGGRRKLKIVGKTRSLRPPRLVWLSLLLALLASAGPAATQIVFLGTGMPRPDPERSGPAVAIVVDGVPYLVDMGTGIVRRAAQSGIKGLEPANLTRAFVTHLHSDHTLGFADLMLTPWIMGRTAPLEVYGPAGIADMATHLLAAYKEDIAIRINGLEHGNATGYRVNAHEIKPGVVYTDSKVKVTAFLVRHGSWPQAFGYRFDTPGRSIVLSGDTSPSPAIAENCAGCDVLIHEAYAKAGSTLRRPGWAEYLASFHTSAAELGAIANQAKPKLLILYHQMYWGSSTEQTILDELRQVYKGPVVSAKDLDVR